MSYTAILLLITL